MGNKLLTLSILLAVFLISFGTYLHGANPTVLYGDSAEIQAVANLGGVAHPSGYPTYILLGQLFR